MDEEDYVNTGSSIFGSDIGLPPELEEEPDPEVRAPYPAVAGVGNPGGFGMPFGAESSAVTAPTKPKVTAGLMIIAVAAGAGAGWYFCGKGVKGGVGGAAATAGARNLYGAAGTMKADAAGSMQRGLIGLLGLGLGGWLLYSGHQGK